MSWWFSEVYPPQYYHICSKLQYQASPNKTRIHLDDKILVACGWDSLRSIQKLLYILGRCEEIRAGLFGCVIMDAPCRIPSLTTKGGIHERESAGNHVGIVCLCGEPAGADPAQAFGDRCSSVEMFLLTTRRITHEYRHPGGSHQASWPPVIPSDHRAGRTGGVHSIPTLHVPAMVDTPNFGVNLEIGYYKCLRCGASGPSLRSLEL